MPKNIVILADGTGQEGGKGYNTNVYKIFNIIEDRSPNQIVYYDPGLGTSGLKLIKQATGLGISKNIKDCYQFLFENFESGDRLYLIGFSRGAATVRSLSTFIHHFGILPKSRPDLIKQAYKIYRTKDSRKLEKKATKFIDKHHTMWAKVHFLGCFDTVDALGFPIRSISAVLNKIPFFRHTFHDFKLSKSVKSAYHALAIDDKRKTFHPGLPACTLMLAGDTKCSSYRTCHLSGCVGKPLSMDCSFTIKAGLISIPNRRGRCMIHAENGGRKYILKKCADGPQIGRISLWFMKVYLNVLRQEITHLGF